MQSVAQRRVAQALATRAATAQRVAAKRIRKRNDINEQHDWKKEKKDGGQQVNAVKDTIRDIKQAIKNDWRMGPNSPKLPDHVIVDANNERIHTISEVRYRSPAMLSPSQKERRCKWLGGFENLNLYIGDRVVLLDGPDKDRIGKISNIEERTAEVIVEDLNKANVRIAPDIAVQGSAPAMNVELPIPISSVRLVHPLRDPKTGRTRDVVIKELVHGKIHHDKISNKKWWDRIVPGLNVVIPPPVDQTPEPPEFASDTRRIDVEKRTFVPTLLRPPVPETLINELRSRTSRFRTRHDPEYIAKLEAIEQAKEDRKQLMVSMRTPLKEFHRSERAARKKKGKPLLTKDMLAEIGKVMARSRERGLKGTGESAYSLDPTIKAPLPPASSENQAPPPPSS